MAVDMLNGEEPAALQAQWHSTAPLDVPFAVTVGVLQDPTLQALRDAPGGVFLLVAVVPQVLKGGVDAVVLLIQNRFGHYVLRAVNGKAAVRAVSAARSDAVAHGSQQGAMNATASYLTNELPASAVPARRPRSGDARVLADVTDAAMARAQATQWLAAPPSAGGFGLPPAKLAVAGVFPRPSEVDVRRAMLREESAAVASEIESLSPDGTAVPGAQRTPNRPLSLQTAWREAAAAASSTFGSGAAASGPLASWAAVQDAASEVGVSPPYKAFVEAVQPAHERSRSPTAASRSSRSSRASSKLAALASRQATKLAELAAARVRELVARRVHEDAAKVLAAHGVDGDALAFLPADAMLAQVADAGVELSPLSVVLFRKAVADAAASLTGAGAQVVAPRPAQVVDLTAADGAPEEGVLPVELGGPAAGQFTEEDAAAAACFEPAVQRSASQIEANRQAALARRAAAAEHGEAVRELIEQVDGEAVELFAAVPAAELPELVSSVAHMLGVHQGAGAAEGGGHLEILTTRVCFQLNALIQEAHTTAQRALAPHGKVRVARNRVVLAVAALASSRGDVRGGVTTTKVTTDAAASMADGAVRSAVSRLASEPRARAALEAALRVTEVDEQGRTDGKRPRLRAAARELETGPFADDVYLLLHQEKLSENPSGQWTQAARAVLGTVCELRSHLAAARERLFARVAPEGVSVSALVAAVNTGTLSVATLVPKGTTSPAAKVAAMLRAWPLLTAVADEVLPRDGGDRGAGHMLLLLSLNAFDYGKSHPEGSVVLVETVLEEWAQCWKRVREGVQRHEHVRALVAYEWTRNELAAKHSGSLQAL